MKNIFNQEELERHLSQFLEIGTSFFQQEQGLKFLESIINYILQATEIKTDIVVSSISTITEKGGEMAMSTAERLRQEGRQEGIQKGIQKGIQEGIQKGMQKGIQKGGYKMMVSMVQNAAKKGLSEEIISQIANIDVESVRRILNNETIDIPLHLLTELDEQAH
ncbi:MAG: hypothetical protein AB7U45_04965 [Desulfamplus sp.]